MTYKAKTLKGAQTRVRQLQKQITACHDLLNRFDYERKMLAKLAAETAQFYNPLDVLEAKRIRDHLLKQPNEKS